MKTSICFVFFFAALVTTGVRFRGKKKEPQVDPEDQGLEYSRDTPHWLKDAAESTQVEESRPWESQDRSVLPPWVSVNPQTYIEDGQVIDPTSQKKNIWNEQGSVYFENGHYQLMSAEENGKGKFLSYRGPLWKTIRRSTLGGAGVAGGIAGVGSLFLFGAITAISLTGFGAIAGAVAGLPLYWFFTSKALVLSSKRRVEWTLTNLNRDGFTMESPLDHYKKCISMNTKRDRVKLKRRKSVAAVMVAESAGKYEGAVYLKVSMDGSEKWLRAKGRKRVSLTDQQRKRTAWKLVQVQQFTKK